MGRRGLSGCSTDAVTRAELARDRRNRCHDPSASHRNQESCIRIESPTQRTDVATGTSRCARRFSRRPHQRERLGLLGARSESRKAFSGSADAHVGYFINPEGVSTSSDGVARSEHRQLLLDYVHLLAVPDPTGRELRPDIRATPISRADRYSAGMIDVLTAMRREAQK